MLTSEPIKCLKTRNIIFSALAVCDNGIQLAAGDDEGNLFLYYSYTLIKKFSDHKNYIITLQFSKAGNYLASGAADNRLILTTLTNYEFKVKIFSDNSSHIIKVGFNENELYLITASSDKTLQIYNTKTYQKIQKIAYNCSLNFADFIGFPQIILFGTQRQVEILNFNRLHKKTKIKPMNFSITRCSLSKNREIQQVFFLSGSKPAKVLLYNMVFFKQIRKFNSQRGHVALDICFKDTQLIVTLQERIEIWDWVTATLNGILETRTRIGQSVLSNDQKLYTISNTEIKIWMIGEK